MSLAAATLILMAGQPALSTASPSPAPTSDPAPDAAPPTTAATAEPPRTAKNTIFFEALGSGLLYSLNYERFFEKWNVGLRGGASYFTYAVSSYGKSGNLTLVSFPLLASYYVGYHNHHLQLGLGTTILYTGVATDSLGTKFDDERSGFGIAASAVVGYRYMPRSGGVSFGAGFTPLLRTSKFLPWGGANVGYTF